MKKILVVAGDPSGDMIASKLVQALRTLEPNVYVTSAGGRWLEKVSDRFLGNLVHQYSFGFTIPIRALRYFRSFLNNVLTSELENNPPDVVIPVDFYGFNQRLVRLAKARGIKVFYYVSPQFWASRPGRADRLKTQVDQFLCLFPFEMEFYQKRGIPAKFVGHPILDTIPEVDPSADVRSRVELNIGLLPGSRIGEIKRHLPVIMEACRIIKERAASTRFFLFTVPEVSKDLYKQMIMDGAKGRFLVELIQDEDYAWRTQMDLAISSSGMETLENAFLGIPMVILYKVNWLNYLLAWMVINTPHIGLPNVLAKRRLVPEFIQNKATAKNIAGTIGRWIENPAERMEIREQLLVLRAQFGGPGASQRAAHVILDTLRS